MSVRGAVNNDRPYRDSHTILFGKSLRRDKGADAHLFCIHFRPAAMEFTQS